jgi:hypothetical protein
MNIFSETAYVIYDLLKQMAPVLCLLPLLFLVWLHGWQTGKERKKKPQDDGEWK